MDFSLSPRALDLQASMSAHADGAPPSAEVLSAAGPAQRGR